MDELEEALRRIYGKRPWLIAAPILQEGGGIAKVVQRYGAHKCFVAAAYMGAGPTPGDDVATWRVLDLPRATIMDALHAGERALRDLPPDFEAAIDAFDPSRRMLALGVFFGNGQPVAGRRLYGARPKAWQDLEDKVVIDALWDAAGIDRAPSLVVDVDEETLAAAARQIDLGAGTVWAGDARDGFSGGAHLTFWVRDEAGAALAFAKLSARCDRARVMPFLDGIPCSIHGVVLPDGVAVFRPNEMVVLRRATGNGLQYMRAATFWDPSDAGRQEMRRAAKRIGEYLRSTYDYRGAFTIDGVMTRDGFRPTELNPRVGAAMFMLHKGFPFSLVHYALIEREPLPLTTDGLEALILTEADAHRRGSLGLALDVPISDNTTFDLVFEAGRWREAIDGEEPHAKGRCGPAPGGGWSNLDLIPDHQPVGQSIGPRAAAYAAWMDARFDAGIGALTPAPDYR